jgi:hypothetical protein
VRSDEFFIEQHLWEYLFLPQRSNLVSLAAYVQHHDCSGYFSREHPFWFLAIPHEEIFQAVVPSGTPPIPVSIGLRLLSGLGWRISTFPLFMAAFFCGQLAGGWLEQVFSPII